MDRAGFRDYVLPLDHPQVARLQGKDAHTHAQAARGSSRAQELLIDRETVLLPLDARQWRTWNNTEIYFFVYGLRMDEISQAARDAICEVLRVSLSDQGYGKTRHAMWLNGYLGGAHRRPGRLGGVEL